MLRMTILKATFISFSFVLPLSFSFPVLNFFAVLYFLFIKYYIFGRKQSHDLCFLVLREKTKRKVPSARMPGHELRCCYLHRIYLENLHNLLETQSQPAQSLGKHSLLCSVIGMSGSKYSHALYDKNINWFVVSFIELNKKGFSNQL